MTIGSQIINSSHKSRCMSFTTRPELIGTFGMVASTHWLASASAMAVLEKGGNAFDAAAAAGFVLQIVEPHLNGPGGELPVVFYSAREDRVRVLCGQGVTPAAMTIGRMREMGLEVVPGTGLLPAVVPGAFGGWMAMLRDYGQLPLEDVLSYAIGYAENGYPVLPRMTSSILAIKDFFQTRMAHLGRAMAARRRSADAEPAVCESGDRADVPAHPAAKRKRAATAPSSANARAKSSIAASWPMRSTSTSARPPCSTRPASATAACSMQTISRAGQPTYEDPVSYDYEGFRVHKTGPWGQGPDVPAAARVAEGLRSRGAWTR